MIVKFIWVQIFILSVIEMVLKKFIFKTEQVDIFRTPGKNIYISVMLSLVLVFFFVYFFVTRDDSTRGWVWLIWFSAMMVFRILWEWKYLKGSKEFVISLISFAIGLILIAAFVV